METNLEKAKRLTRDNAAIKGINLPDTNFFYEMLELAATPDAVDKNDLLPDVSCSLARIVTYEKFDKEEPRDYNISYGLEIDGMIVCWFAKKNPHISKEAQDKELKKIDLYKELVRRINYR
jgi:hypothetical protein